MASEYRFELVRPEEMANKPHRSRPHAGYVSAHLLGSESAIGQLSFHAREDEPTRVELEQIEVDDAHEGQGVASRMFERLIEAYPDSTVVCLDSSLNTCVGVRWMNRQRIQGRWIHTHECPSFEAPCCGCQFTRFECPCE